MTATAATTLTIGVLALQGSFEEHVNLLRSIPVHDTATKINVIQVKTVAQLATVSALIIPGGESTAMSLIAQRTHLLQPLRDFVQRAKHSHDGYSVWGTCAGMILLGEEVLGGKLKGEGEGSERLGGMDVKVVRNQWGRQSESFSHPLSIPVLSSPSIPYPAIFIRAPVLHSLLPVDANSPPIEILSRIPIEILPVPKIPAKAAAATAATANGGSVEEEGGLATRMVPTNGDPRAATELGPSADVVMLRQGGLLVTSFHPELTNDVRVHEWWVRSMCMPKAVV